LIVLLLAQNILQSLGAIVADPLPMYPGSPVPDRIRL
jgi:hypothetical protein